MQAGIEASVVAPDGAPRTGWALDIGGYCSGGGCWQRKPPSGGMAPSAWSGPQSRERGWQQPACRRSLPPRPRDRRMPPQRWGPSREEVASALGEAPRTVSDRAGREASRSVWLVFARGSDPLACPWLWSPRSGCTGSRRANETGFASASPGPPGLMASRLPSATGTARFTEG